MILRCARLIHICSRENAGTSVAGNNAVALGDASEDEQPKGKGAASFSENNKAEKDYRLQKILAQRRKTKILVVLWSVMRKLERQFRK